ncbi:MAG: AlpA family phage regulatory protein [Methylophaga sp.]|nr:AlpA family phage regulatory protein [Methylophaga sp.]
MAHEKLINLSEVKARTSRSKTTLYRLINNGEFPAPIKIGRSSVWPESEVNEWIINLIIKSRMEAV